jgi:hypothetical protein
MIKESLEAVEKLVMPSRRFIWVFLIWTILLAIAASLFANVMSRYSLELKALFVSVVLLISIFVFIMYYLQKMKKRILFNYKPLAKTNRYKGLIAFVSEPPKDFIKNNEAKEDWFNNCKNIIDGFVSSGKKNSNALEKILGIGPIFKAINHHSEVLSHCWLIHTDNSDINVKIIKYFFKMALNDSIKPDFVRISDPNNPKLINETIEEIYTNLPEDINAADIISDITSGTKPMTAGMIISCLNGYHKIEYVEQSEKADLIEIDLSPKLIVKL